MTTIDPSFLTVGGEWSVGGAITGPELGDAERGLGVDGAGGADGGGGFGSMLSKQITNLEELQVDAAEKSRALATGEATDPAEVVMAVERARLSMQLAAQLRTKGIESFTEVMRTQV